MSSTLPLGKSWLLPSAFSTETILSRLSVALSSRQSPEYPGLGRDQSRGIQPLNMGVYILGPLKELICHQLLQIPFVHRFALSNSRTGGIVVDA